MSSNPEVVFEDWERERIRGVGVLSTIGSDGTPHAAPVGIRLENGTLRFETQEGSVKLRNIDRDPKVSVLIFGQPKWGILVRGVAEVITRGEEGQQPQIRVIPTSKASWRRKEG